MINWIRKKYRQICGEISSELNEKFVRVEPNEFIICNEVYTGYSKELPITYNLNIPQRNSDKLIVVFSGFNSKEVDNQFTYNYMRALQYVNCNKLFILDKYGPRGCYYLGKNMSFDMEKAVIALIKDIANKLNILEKDIITVGSSKGGSAAIYYGIKYGFGNIIAGVPQTKIADYVLQATEETAEFMLGDIEDKKRIDTLNNVIFKLFTQRVDSKVHILTSKYDSTHKIHVMPLLEEMKKSNVNYRYKLDDDIKKHSEIGIYFPRYLLEVISEELYGFVFKKLDVIREERSLKILVKYNITDRLKFEGVYCNIVIKNVKGDKYTYHVKDEEVIIEDLISGEYSILVQFYDEQGEIISFPPIENVRFSSQYNMKKYRYEINTSYLEFELDIVTYEEVFYAFYIFKDGQRIHSQWYSKNKAISYKIEEEGQYNIRYFIKDSDNNIVYYDTEKLIYKN